jgi:glyoxylase-like metal-dependent hydrolase (beta-lactamase superfamily II)
MPLEQVSDNCFVVLNEKNRVCDANSGLVNRAGGVVIDTQSDLTHTRQMIEMFNQVWPAMPKRVINTHEDADHVWGNQLFAGAEIQITFERLGTLRCRFGEPTGKLLPSRWPVRPPLQKYHG